MDKDRKMIEKWFLTYADSVYAFIYERTGKNKQTAKDVLQETFLEAIKNISSYQPSRGNVLIWLIMLSRNQIKKAVTQQNRFSNHIDNNQTGNDGLYFAMEKISDEPLPDEILQKRETAELVQLTLASIPEKYRAVLEQFYYQRKMIKQIAEDTGKSQIIIKITLHRARKAFKKALLKNSKSLYSVPASERGVL